MRLRKQRWMAEAVEPRRAGDTSRTMMAAGARQASLSAKPTRSAANDCWYSGDSSDIAIIGAAAMDAPARQLGGRAEGLTTYHARTLGF